MFRQTIHIVLFAVAVLLSSCDDPDAITGAKEPNSNEKTVLSKLDVSDIHLLSTELVNRGNNEWCGALRVFGNDGQSLPSYSDYVWEYDPNIFDNVEEWVSWHNGDWDGGNSMFTDGHHNYDSMGRFLIRVHYNGMVTPPFLLGADLRNLPVSGSPAADAMNLPDSDYMYGWAE